MSHDELLIKILLAPTSLTSVTPKFLNTTNVRAYTYTQCIKKFKITLHINCTKNIERKGLNNHPLCIITRNLENITKCTFFRVLAYF